jgi:hypothetical protein
MIQKNGNFLPGVPSGRPPKFDYAEVIGIALRSELGSNPQSAQIVANWTGATERTAQNWLSGIAGPNGLYLIRLLRKSDAVLETVLSLAARGQVLERFYESQRESSKKPIEWNDNSSRRGIRDAGADDPDRDPDDPKIDPDAEDAPSPRQLWFLQELRRKPAIAAGDIALFFGVSLKTAKRDIASLKRSGLVRFVGSRRRGHYVLVSI